VDRRGFFGRFAAMLAAPAVLGSVDKPRFQPGQTLDVIYGRFPHECEWRDLPARRSAQQCLVCGDVRSRIQYQQDMLDVVGEMSPKDTLLLDGHLDAMWANGKPAHEIWGPAVNRLRPGTSAP